MRRSQISQSGPYEPFTLMIRDLCTERHKEQRLQYNSGWLNLDITLLQYLKHVEVFLLSRTAFDFSCVTVTVSLNRPRHAHFPGEEGVQGVAAVCSACLLDNNLSVGVLDFKLPSYLCCQSAKENKKQMRNTISFGWEDVNCIFIHFAECT